MHRRIGERVGDTVDINRDFPFNSKPEDCLNTIGARVVHQIFT